MAEALPTAPSMIPVSLNRVHWLLVIAAIDAARTNIAEDVRLKRPSFAGKEVLTVALGEYETIRLGILEAIDDSEAA